jgi:PHD/YefM family antitoxin component YafN of YafNO toxin-antitoxin module
MVSRCAERVLAVLEFAEASLATACFRDARPPPGGVIGRSATRSRFRQDWTVDYDMNFMLGRFIMDSTYSVTQAQTNLPRLIKEAAVEGSIAITRHEETVAYLISRGRMDAIMETLELLGNPAAMKALRNYEEGKTRFLPLAALNGDKG